MTMHIKGFDSVNALGEYYGGEVFRSVADDMLFVFSARQNIWLRYRWTRGKREVRFVGEHLDELPLVTQIYPQLDFED